MSDGDIALLILFGLLVMFAAAMTYAAVNHPKEFAQAVQQGIQKTKDDWAAKQEAKKKSREETAGKIVDVLANIMKKRS
jgi:hypothetical protein